MTTEEILSLVSKILGTIGMVLVLWGISKRRTPRVHVPVMFWCLGIDLANVVLIEVVGHLVRGQGAVAEALAESTKRQLTLLNVHVTFAVLTLVGYAIAVETGRRLLRGDQAVRRFHRWNGWTFVAIRTATWGTSFWL